MALIDKSNYQILDKNRIIDPVSPPYYLIEEESGSICVNTTYVTNNITYVLPTITVDNVGIYYTFIPTDTTYRFFISSSDDICYQDTIGNIISSSNWSNGISTDYNKYSVLKVQSVNISFDYRWIVISMMGKWNAT